MGAVDRRAVSKTLFAVILILVVALAGGVGYYALNNQGTPASPSPSPSTIETPLPSQTVTPTLNSSPAGPVVTVTYTKWMGPMGTDLAMDVTVRNQGYTAFDTNATNFYVIFNGTRYGYNSGWTRTYGSWEAKVISNNGENAGTMFFSVPKSNSIDAYTLYYKDDSNSYNIVYEPK